MENRNGHALVFSLVILLLVLAILGVSVTKIIGEQKIQQLQLHKKKSYYYAEGGVEHLSWKAREGQPVTRGTFNCDNNTYQVEVKDVRQILLTEDEPEEYLVMQVSAYSTGYSNQVLESIYVEFEFHYIQDDFKKIVLKDYKRVN
ncbi:Tfp pilus assembly protein PilX [Desulfitispora alkaliphila]|uniref:hypothetical protein n=1 Tax=Desulfitispora alkaliphila TaxID=622674 RepID=UPI003D21B5FC